MSWSCSTRGVRGDALVTLEADGNIPPGIRDATNEVMGEFAEGAELDVKTSGHINHETGTGNAVISVQTI